MDGHDLEYDIFLSYNNKDEDAVKKLFEEFLAAGLMPFFAPVSLAAKVGTEEWQEAILQDAIPSSYHFAVYCSKDVAGSAWVKNEIAQFRRTWARQDEHRILAIADPDLTDAELEKVLTEIGAHNVLRPRSPAHALHIVAEQKIKHLTSALTEIREELSQANDLARQSFEYYRHSRFWRPFSEPSKGDLHIFTCGRDTEEERRQRGVGGRTSIDKWDYQAAVDITHYFARHHRDIGVQIEQPVSKARIDSDTRAFDSGKFTRHLSNRNCVIIGSPDVSDFAETTLAELLGVRPYAPDIKLDNGFRIRKDGPRFSTFYSQTSDGEPDGVLVFPEGEAEEFYESDDNHDHGVMILADNPFSNENHKVLILAGHSGVATRSMSMLLTHDDGWCLNAFYELDQQVALMSGSDPGDPIAAVIEVGFKLSPGHDEFGDKREIKYETDAIRVLKVLALRY